MLEIWRWDVYPGPLETLQSTGRNVQLLRTKRPIRTGVQPEEKDTHQKSGNSRGCGKRVMLVGQEGFGDEDDDYMVLNIEGGNNEVKPYYMEEFIDGSRFKAMIDTGSPVTIFALDEIKRIMKREKLPVRQIIKGERYVDFNGKPLQLLGYVFCDLQVNDSYIKKAKL